MKFKNPEFIKSVYNIEEFPRHRLPEIAFSGKSNVGKSSLINKLVSRKNLARISSTPGKTQSINFYNIDNKFYLVDLPGYGYAKAPKKLKDQWAELIDTYLFNRPNLTGIIQLIDIRHKPTEDDQLMVDWLKKAQLPAAIVATKADKLSKNKQIKQKKIIKNVLQLPEIMDLILFSAKTGTGKGKVIGFIRDCLN